MDVNSRLNELIRTSESDNSNELFSTTYSTLISYHTKTPQFYDEIKMLLPLNLNEKHHLLFKFYHISCTNASNAALLSANVETEANTKMCENIENNIETLVGYAWLPLFKKGRILVHNQKINLAVAQTLPNQYLSFNSQTTAANVSESTSQIKWVDNMKPIFKVNCIVNSSVHTYVKRVFLIYFTFLLHLLINSLEKIYLFFRIKVFNRSLFQVPLASCFRTCLKIL